MSALPEIVGFSAIGSELIESYAQGGDKNEDGARSGENAVCLALAEDEDDEKDEDGDRGHKAGQEGENSFFFPTSLPPVVKLLKRIDNILTL
jgi:hypothetical protein